MKQEVYFGIVTINLMAVITAVKERKQKFYIMVLIGLPCSNMHMSMPKIVIVSKAPEE